MINVLVVDDHEFIRTGIDSSLKKIDDISVVGMANSGEQALLLTEQLSPDVILMDINMPGMGGIAACRRILQDYPETKIIALSGYNDEFIPKQLLQLGAMGFLSKISPADELIDAIRQVMLGSLYLGKDVAQNLLVQSEQQINNPFGQLSKRESQVTRLILEGKSIQEMAEDLKLSDKTVNTYRYRLYEKLNAKNDVELTRLAIKWNYEGRGVSRTKQT